MPSTEKKGETRRSDSDMFLVAVEGFAVADLVVKEGTVLPADHPAVAARPDLFVRVGATDDEIRERRLKLGGYLDTPPPSGPDDAARFVPPRLRDEDAVVAIRSVPQEQGDGIAPGDRVAKSDPVVRRHQDAFVPVVPRGVVRERALVARSTLEVADDEEDRGRVVYAGTWVDREDPIAAVHEHQFHPPHEEVSLR